MILIHKFLLYVPDLEDSFLVILENLTPANDGLTPTEDLSFKPMPSTEDPS